MMRMLAIIFLVLSCKNSKKSDLKDVPVGLQHSFQTCVDQLRSQALDGSIFKNIEGFNADEFKKLNLDFFISSDQVGVREIQMKSGLGLNDKYSVSWNLELESDEVIVDKNVKSSILLMTLETTNVDQRKIVTYSKQFRVDYGSTTKSCKLQNAASSKVDYEFQPSKKTYAIHSLDSDLLNGTQRPSQFEASEESVLNIVYDSEHLLKKATGTTIPYLIDSRGMEGFIRVESGHKLELLSSKKEKLLTLVFKLDGNGEIQSLDIPESGIHQDKVNQNEFSKAKFAYEGITDAQSLSDGVKDLNPSDLLKSDFYLELSGVHSTWNYNDTEFYFATSRKGENYVLSPRKIEPQFVMPTPAEVDANRKYLRASDYIQLNHEAIVKFEKKFKARKLRFEDTLVEILRETAALIDYDDESVKNQSIHKLKLSEVLAKRKGVCQHYALIFVALARKVGIASRIVGGLHFDGADGHLEAISHAWVEVLIKGGRWVPLEPQTLDNGNEPFDALRSAVVSHTYFPIDFLKYYDDTDGRGEDRSKSNAMFHLTRLNYNLKSLGELPNNLKTGYAFESDQVDNGSVSYADSQVYPAGNESIQISPTGNNAIEFSPTGNGE